MNKCPYCGNPTSNFAEIQLINDLQKSLEAEKARNEFLQKATDEQFRILLTKYWLTHPNEQVFSQFGCNYVPNLELQDEARKFIDVGSISFTNEQLSQINKSVIKSQMKGYLNFAI